MNIDYFIMAVLVIFCIASYQGYSKLKRKWDRETKRWEAWQNEKISNFKKYYLQFRKEKVGDKEVEFVTLDDGKKWYQIERCDDGSVNVLLNPNKKAQAILVKKAIDDFAMLQLSASCRGTI